MRRLFVVRCLLALHTTQRRLCAVGEPSRRLRGANGAKPQLGEVPKGEPNCGGAVATLERKPEGISL
jgi:hypothetical protein